MTPATWEMYARCGMASRHRLSVAVGTIITDRPRTDPYVHVYVYGSIEDEWRGSAHWDEDAGCEARGESIGPLEGRGNPSPLAHVGCDALEYFSRVDKHDA